VKVLPKFSNIVISLFKFEADVLCYQVHQQYN